MAKDPDADTRKLERLRLELIDLLENFEDELLTGELRAKVLALVPVRSKLDKLGAGLIPRSLASSAQLRILHYFQTYPYEVLKGAEIRVVAGISEWARRIRELRKEQGWKIYNGITLSQMVEEEPLLYEGTPYGNIKKDEYVLLETEPDRDAAHRWHTANRIRKSQASVQQKIISFFRENVGRPISGEELRYVAKEKTEWARRTRELRTQAGWPIVTKNTGRPDLPIGIYILEEDRQSPEHDRSISDEIRGAVLRRDDYRCQRCQWSHDLDNRSDARHLELHHIRHHAHGGENTKENLITLCTVCHDAWHAVKDNSIEFSAWLSPPT